MKEKILLRSMLYIPGYMDKYFDNVEKIHADAIVLDIEDSVPDHYKQEARIKIKNFLDSHQKSDCRVYVRLNSIESRLLFNDLEYVLHKSVNGFLLTKIRSADDIIYYDKLFSQMENDNGYLMGGGIDYKFSFLPMIETPEAVVNCHSIAAATKRIEGLVFGGEDFLLDMGGYHGIPPKGLDYARSLIALAARAANVLPIDTPYLNIRDKEGFIKEERISFEIGFAGIQCLHPFQVPLANTVFMPTEKEIQEAKEIISAIEESSKSGIGVAMLHGNMIGPPMMKRVKRVLELADQCQEKERHQNTGGKS